MEPHLTVHSDPQGDGLCFWEVYGPRRHDVQREITTIQMDGDVVESEFYLPWFEVVDGKPRFRSTGYTRLREGLIAAATATACELVALVLFVGMIAVWAAIATEARGELIWSLLELLHRGIDPDWIGPCVRDPWMW